MRNNKEKKERTSIGILKSDAKAYDKLMRSTGHTDKTIFFRILLDAAKKFKPELREMK